MILNSVGYLLFSLFMLSFLSICGVFFISHKISSTWIKYLIRIAGTLFVLFLSYGLLAISYFG